MCYFSFPLPAFLLYCRFTVNDAPLGTETGYLLLQLSEGLLFLSVTNVGCTKTKTVCRDTSTVTAFPPFLFFFFVGLIAALPSP
jgi:hypothetical protein